MAKRRGREDKSNSEAGGGPFNAAFGGLAALREQMGPPATEAEPEPESEPEGPGGPRAAGGKVVVRREKKGRGGKTVTCVEGLAEDGLEALARQLGKQLGCGAKLEEGVIILQGDQTQRAATFLKEQGLRKVVVGN